MLIVEIARSPFAEPCQLEDWSACCLSPGDYAVVSSTLQIVGEELCEVLDSRSNQRVLDGAAGNGNVPVIAARRWCELTSTDYVPALLERGRAGAKFDGLAVTFWVADAAAARSLAAILLPGVSMTVSLARRG